MITKEFHVTSGSQFGKRITILAAEKERVGKAVVNRILWRNTTPSNPILITDGSSGSFVFCHYLQRCVENSDDSLRVWTNNTDVSLQASCHPGASPNHISVHCAPGRFSAKYCGTFGNDARQWIEEHCSKCTCILSVTALDVDLGPCGRGEDAKDIKAAVLRMAKQLIIVADYEKLRQPRDADHAAAPDLWLKWRDEHSKSGRLFVVTTKSQGLKDGRFPVQGGVDNKRSPDEIEAENHARFRIALGDQYMVV